MARKRKKKSYLTLGTKVTKRTKKKNGDYTVTGYTKSGNPIKKIFKGLF